MKIIINSGPRVRRKRFKIIKVGAFIKQTEIKTIRMRIILAVGVLCGLICLVGPFGLFGVLGLFGTCGLLGLRGMI